MKFTIWYYCVILYILNVRSKLVSWNLTSNNSIMSQSDKMMSQLCHKVISLTDGRDVRK